VDKIMALDSGNLILSFLSPSDLTLLTPYLTNTSFEQGLILFEQDQHIDHFYFPFEGMVSLVALLEDGSSIELAAVGREGLVGTALANGTGQSPMTAIIQVAGKGLKIGADHFHSALLKSADLRAVVGHHTEALLAQLVRTVACNAMHAAEARLCRWLLMVRDRVDSDIIQLTQEFLGQMLGVQRTTVTLVARSLQTAGLIRYRRGYIEILDRDGLEEAACDCYEINRRHFDRLVSLRRL
jgi:CRP-like cAMP-binding protein